MAMAWVVRIREVRQVSVEAEPEQVGLRRGPVVMKLERVISELRPEAWARLVRAPVALPLHTGAGPCGSDTTHAEGRTIFRGVPVLFGGQASPFGWSIANLIDPLAAYYATYEPPLRFGAKPGPRGRRAA